MTEFSEEPSYGCKDMLSTESNNSLQVYIVENEQKLKRNAPLFLKHRFGVERYEENSAMTTEMVDREGQLKKNNGTSNIICSMLPLVNRQFPGQFLSGYCYLLAVTIRAKIQ